MLDRIKALMAARQLSPSQFADLTTLPRPVVSHILSGRNKPSLEAAQKIMAAFPDISIDWLLNGRGAMAGPEAALNSAAGSPPIAPPLAMAPTSEPVARTRAARTPRAAAPIALAPIDDEPPTRGAAPVEAAYSVPPISAPASLSAASSTAALTPPAPAIVQQVVRPERAVRRIMVFYSDGTFSDHRPLPTEEAPFF